MRQRLVAGQYSLPTHYDDGHIIPEKNRYKDLLGIYPIRYWDVIEEEEPKPIPRKIPPLFPPYVTKEPKKCKRCLRAIKPQYQHCYRCHMYLLKKKDGEVL